MSKKLVLSEGERVVMRHMGANWVSAKDLRQGGVFVPLGPLLRRLLNKGLLERQGKAGRVQWRLNQEGRDVLTKEAEQSLAWRTWLAQGNGAHIED